MNYIKKIYYLFAAIWKGLKMVLHIRKVFYVFNSLLEFKTLQLWVVIKI